MATLTITVPDNVITRIRAAYGTPGAPATVGDVQIAVKNQIREYVLSRELQAARDAITVARAADIDAANNASRNEGAW